MLLDRIRAAAAVRLDCALAEIEITGSHAGARDGRSVALAELAEDGLKADASQEDAVAAAFAAAEKARKREGQSYCPFPIREFPK